MYDEIDGAQSTSSTDCSEVAVADKDLAKKKTDKDLAKKKTDNNLAKKKAKQVDDRQKKEAKLAAANRMAEKIFSHQAAECVKCKLLSEEISSVKGELEKRAKQLEDLKRNENLKDQQLVESQEKIADLESSVKAKKRVIDSLEKEKVEQAKRIKSG